MNRKFILLSILLLGIMTVFGCKNPARPKKAEIATVKKDSTEIKAAVKLVVNTPSQVYSKPEVPILCYHRIATGMKSEFEISPETFNAHMKMLADSGYHSISPDQLYDYLVNNKPLPSKPVMITFDDSRIEHYLIAAPVLEKYGFRGVFFIMTITYNKKNYMSTDQIAELSRRGHTIGLHSWDHVMVTKYSTPADWKKEVTDPKIKLEKIINKQVNYWAYPDGIYNHHAAEVLSKDFKISFSLATPRDSTLPLQCVRRMIVPEWSAQTLLKSMRQTFKKKHSEQKAGV